MTTPPNEVVPVTAIQRTNTGFLLSKAIEEGSAIEVIEKLVELDGVMQDRAAREAWHQAMSHAQKNMPAVAKNSVNPFLKNRYANLDDILATVRPVLADAGLSVRWRGGITDDGRSVWQTCIVAHELGHEEESGKVVLPIPASGSSGANPAQSVGMVKTYARRYSLQDVVSVAAEEDTDGEDRHVAGKPPPRRHDQWQAPPPPSREQPPGPEPDTSAADLAASQLGSVKYAIMQLVKKQLKQAGMDATKEAIKSAVECHAKACGYGDLDLRLDQWESVRDRIASAPAPQPTAEPTTDTPEDGMGTAPADATPSWDLLRCIWYERVNDDPTLKSADGALANMRFGDYRDVVIAAQAVAVGDEDVAIAAVHTALLAHAKPEGGE